jgi:uncharacterized repeat protein (TIGR03847 family)
MPETNDLGSVAHLSAEAIGQPGQRRFRLLAMSQQGTWAFVWMEKEQLAALGDAIGNLLRAARYEYTPTPLDDFEPAHVAPLAADIEFQVGQLSLGARPDEQRIVIAGKEVADEESGEGDPLSVSLEFEFRRAYELSRQIAEVVAAGRPPCPLCGGPIDPSGHICPKLNGHHAR